MQTADQPDPGQPAAETLSEMPARAPTGRSWNATVVFFSALGGFLFGYDTGVISGALPYLKEELLGDAAPEVADAVLGTIVSSAVWAAAVGALAGGHVSDRLGRRPALMLADALFISGSLLMGLVATTAAVVAGRVLVGLGVGVASVTVPVFLAECTEPRVRAELVTANVLMITGGQLVSYVVNYALTYAPGTWRWMLGVAAAPAALQLVGLQLLPETPQWLLAKGHEERSEKAVQTLYPRHMHAAVTAELQREVVAQRAEGRVSLVGVLRDRLARAQLHVGVTLQLLQQALGINTVMYFTPLILQLAGFTDRRQALLWACLPAAANVAGTIAGMRAIERAGRRRLLLGSMGATMCVLVALAVAFRVSDTHAPPVAPAPPDLADATCNDAASCSACLREGCAFCMADGLAQGFCVGRGACDTRPGFSAFVDGCPSPYSHVLLALVMLYLLVFAVGVGPVPWAVNAEIYSLPFRGAASGVAGTANWLANGVVSQTFLLLVHGLTAAGAFMVYAAIAALGIGWVLRCLPETKGLSLSEIQDLFEERLARRGGAGRAARRRRREPLSSNCETQLDGVHSNGSTRSVLGLELDAS